MARVHVFADEAGDFDFDKGSKYFILTTVSLGDEAVSHALLDLRRELTWDGFDITGPFHAQSDPTKWKFRVMKVLSEHDFRINAILLNKERAYDRIRVSNLRFYKTAWFYHLRSVAPKVARATDQLLIVAAKLTTAMKVDAVHFAIQDVVEQVTPCPDFRVAIWPAAVDPGLQVADYCAWAIQRKWESGKDDAYRFIADKIDDEWNIFGG